MRHRLLTSGWVAAHIFVLVCVVVFSLLGWWQWQVAQSATGGAQNFGYALQWPAFAILLVYVWAKHARDEMRPRAEGDGDTPTPGTSTNRVRALTKEQTRPGAAGQLSLASKSEPAHAAAEDDPEVAAYNRYLAQLSALHERYGR